MTELRFTLTAAGTAPADSGRLTGSLTLTAGDLERRVIRGDIAPIGVVGFTSWGPTIIEAGAIEAPADMGRVKLLVQHNQEEAAVGLLAEFKEHEDRYAGAFRVPADPSGRGDAALFEAAEGLRDGLSVGLHLTEYTWNDEGTLVVKAAELTEVSLVTIPAFTDARVASVAATRKETPMNPRELLAAKLAAGEIDRAHYDAELAKLDAAASTPNPSAPAGATPSTPAGVEAQAPAPIVPAGTTAPRGLDLRAAAREAASYLRSGGNPRGLAAALSDIVPANDAGQAHLRPMFIQELWSADRTKRPIIDALGSPQELTGIEVVGWRYVGEPEVEPYAGNKTAIPSNTWTTEPVTAPVQDFAGGWDIARKYIDLGSPSFIADTFRRAVGSYKRNTEAYVTGEILEAATVVPNAGSLPAALATLGVEAVTIGAELGFVKLSTDLWSDFVNLSDADIPWWLKAQGEISLGTVDGQAGGIRFSAEPELAAGTILAGDGNAATYYEVEPPVQVRAENIPNGGVDLGVFGYAALIINDARALFRTGVTVAP